MNIEAISHIAVGVRDMDRALTFYRDMLGLRVDADRIEEFAQGPDEPPARRRAVFLRWADGPYATYIILDQQLTKDTVGAPAQLFQAGIHHFSFWVHDLGAIMERVRAAGLPVVFGDENAPGDDTEWYGEAPGGRIRNVILRDPEGNYVQFDQRV